jgi:hypothetical protein
MEIKQNKQDFEIKRLFCCVYSGRNVRFTPKSGHWLSALGCPLCAKSGHFALRKGHQTAVNATAG